MSKPPTSGGVGFGSSTFKPSISSIDHMSNQQNSTLGLRSNSKGNLPSASAIYKSTYTAQSPVRGTSAGSSNPLIQSTMSAKVDNPLKTNQFDLHSERSID